MEFSQRLNEAIHADPEKPRMEFRGRVFTSGEMAGFGDKALALLESAGVTKDQCVGIILRNRPVHAAVVQGLIAAPRPITTIYAMQSVEAMAADIAQTGFAAIIADAQDWTEAVIEAARSTGSIGIRLSLDAAEPVSLVEGLGTLGTGPYRTSGEEAGVEILSSGTTGKPKRMLFPYRLLVRAVQAVSFGRGNAAVSADIVTLPFTSIGGMCSLSAGPIIGRYTALLEKFNVPEFAEAVRRLRPTTLAGPPAIVRMLIDAKLPREDMSSVRHWFGGGAPFPPELQDEFEEAYGVRTLWAYGATEFCGTAMGWTIDLDAQYRQAKRGAVGRAFPGVTCRIVDRETGEPLPYGEEGLMEVLIDEVGPEWIRTNDVMVMDEDGFAWHRGRGDGAINRGGFKILPEKILFALQEHPAVLDAGVVGIPDHRLGEVPVAAVELREGVARPTEEELRDHLRKLIPANAVPTRIKIVDALPRTTSLKVELGGLKRLFAEEAAAA